MSCLSNKIYLLLPCTNPMRLSCISLFCNLVSKVNLLGLFPYPPTLVLGLRKIIHIPPPLYHHHFCCNKTANRQRVHASQLCLYFSHRPNVCLCVKLCVTSMPRLTHKSREDKLVNEEQGPPSPHLPFLSLSSFPLSLNTLIPLSLSSLIPLSHAFTLFFLSLPKLAQLSISPPAVPPAVCPPRTRNPTTIQVTGQEKEQAAFTIDQWRPIKQSFLFSPPASLHCWQDWKRQTFVEVAEEGGSPLGQQPPRHLLLLTIASRTTMINTLVHTSSCSHHSIFALYHPCLCLFSRAIMSFNMIIKVKLTLLLLVQ